MGDMDDMGDMDGMDDMDDMDDMGGMGGMDDTSEDSVAGLVDAIADAISDYTGVDVSSEQTGEEALDELPPAEGEEMPMDQEMGEVPDEEDLDGVEMDDEPDEEEIIAETMKRVTRRIRNMQKRERLAESVTNRIMKKIAKQSRKR
jgi:transcriptional regulator NrdR family protein